MARIGVAMSDPTGFLAQPFEVVRRTSDKAAVEAIVEISRANDVEQIVVGLPKNMNGSEGHRAEQCREFSAMLESCANLPVTLYDERLTTVAAERMLISADVRRQNRKQVVDAVAASIMLQGYLDFVRNRKRVDDAGGQGD